MPFSDAHLRKNQISLVAAWSSIWLLGATHISAQDAVPKIVCGMSTAMSGPAADLGKNMQAGVLAAFDEVNRNGGLNGVQLELITLDDGYEPARTIPNMRRLTEQENVVAIIGNVGTPTAIAAIPIANATKTPFVGAYTGAGVLRKDPPDRYVMNYRASYAEETAAMVEALIEYGGLDPTEIAFFTQRDGYGDAGFVGGVEALKRRGLTNDGQVAHGRYERNTLAIEHGLAEVLLHGTPPKAIIMVGAYSPCAKFIRLAKEMEFEGLFLNVSFVGSDSLATSLEGEVEDVIVTQVVPPPSGLTEIASRHRQALAQWNPERKPTHGSFEGYIAATILIRALQTIPGTIAKQQTIEALESLNDFDIGLGQNLSLNKKEHQACHRVWPTILKGGQFIPFRWEQLEGMRQEEVSWTQQ